ncbi:uncharacterized protein EDB91DRAFT_352723 [Suillus paluster]|uniref:uncharacterized protein n=1 Tax=Suillus paluster TaxID=48578 RepID=UPI001B85CAC6|nr:uncharacterized protein EDB91DRAFT_352723 [Suillus paluster]KAG1740498.1 hypothetical protein EDB91DRAFT_352723 [Suillus paluster]
MHHALFLPEIACNIFEFLNPFLSGPEDCDEPNLLRLRDLVAVAVTCHALSGPALDVLWDTQMCFGPLLMCMPPSVVQAQNNDLEPDSEDEEWNIAVREEPELFKQPPSIHLIQDPLPSDLLHMPPYARRIKRIGSPVTECRWPLPERFSISCYIINWLLLAYPIEFFLPRLTHMSYFSEINEINGAGISLAPLSRSNLTSLEFYPTFDDKVDGWPLLSSLVNDLPQLRTIRMRVFVFRRYEHTLYSGAIAPLCLFRNLEHLDLSISGQVSEGLGFAGLQIKFPRLQRLKLSSDTIFAVGFLTALQATVLHTLDFVVDRDSSAGNQPERLARHRLFPSLRCLTIASDICFMTSLIEVIHSSTLDSISLTFPYTSDKHTVPTLMALILSKSGWESSLRTITIKKTGVCLGLDGPHSPSHPYFLSIEDLLVFSHLQHVILDDLVIPLNNTLYKKLATSWPDLVEFYSRPTAAPRSHVAVVSGHGIVVTPLQVRPVIATVDLGSLVTFARHCPKLSRLQLGILLDTTEIPVLDDETLTILSSRPTRSTCMRISVHADSSPTNPKAVAKFLATIFPGREIKIVLVASFCHPYRCTRSNRWYEVVEHLRKSQPSSLELGRCYRTNVCVVCYTSVMSFSL